MLLLLPATALAGDADLYDRALDLVEQHYLRPAELDPESMFRGAGQSLEDAVDWLIVDETASGLALADGGGAWRAEVALGDPRALPQALARLEDAVRAAGRPIDEDTDVRVEILRGVTGTLDRHSVILHARGLERFDERLSGVLSGVGATISARTGVLGVTELVPGGPAERSGLRVGDVLLRVDGVSTVGMTPNDATSRIRGVAGTTVSLLVRGLDGAERTLSIRREEITIRNVRASVAHNGVAVVTIDHFSEQTRAWMDRALAELAAEDRLRSGLVIDLRGNTGGSLIQSAQTADAFVGAGTIVTTVGRDGQPVPSLVPRLEAKPDVPALDMPIVVLMDAATASGSEILAGALAELDRAVLVGERSFGKGTVQKIYQIDPAIKLKLTVAEYLVEGTRSVADVGLAPDVATEGVHVDADGAGLPDPMTARAHLAASVPVVTYLEEDGRDAPLELAAEIAAAGSGVERSALLDTARAVVPAALAQEDARVTAAFRGVGIDWSTAPSPGAGGPPPATPPDAPDLVAAVDPIEPVVAGREGRLRVRVRNVGGPVWRATLRLASANPVWDGRVAAIGHLPAGAERALILQVDPPTGAPARTDDVAITLDADGATGIPVGTARLSVVGAPPLDVEITARAVAESGGARIDLALLNRSTASLSGVTARFLFPDTDGLELIDARSAPVGIAPRAVGQTPLRVAVADAYADALLPLTLELETAEGRSLRVPLEIPRDGRAVHVAPPSVRVDLPAEALPVGTARLRVRATDDGPLDHVLVFAGSERVERRRTGAVRVHDRDKVAWRPLRGRRGDLVVDVPVRRGANRYVVIAEDRTGLRSSVDVYILGEANDTADTTPETPQ
jgi:C-terminal peptidase prc